MYSVEKIGYSAFEDSDVENVFYQGTAEQWAELDVYSSNDSLTKANIHYENCTDIAKQNRNLLISTSNNHGLIVNENEWWHYYDCRLIKYGMKYNYSESQFVPIDEKKVFILK